MANILANFEQLPKEEKANAITHGMGFCLSLFGGLLLLQKPGVYASKFDFLGVLAFVFSLMILYAASTVYHLFSNHGKKGIFQVFDHAAIFALIAGTYTPFLLGPLRQHISGYFLAMMWSIALAGILYKIFFTHKYRLLSTIIYLAMGWMAVIKIKTFYAHLSAGALWWILIGGIFYSLGTVFYTNKNIKFNHAIWHLFVLGGSASHFFAIYFYVY